MSDTARVTWVQWLGRVVTGWPRLSLAAALGAAVIVLSLAFGARPITALLVGWDVGMILFLGLLIELMVTAEVEHIRRYAARQDVGQIVVLTLSAVAALLSVVAIYAEVSLGNGGSIAKWRLALGVLTIVLSWFFVQAMFALHYAHEYYGAARGEAAGLVFPGVEEPDYWDFAYISLVIGMCAQVSDVTVTSRRIRRAIMAHSIVAFWFNVAVLALLINIAADAIRS